MLGMRPASLLAVCFTLLAAPSDAGSVIAIRGPLPPGSGDVLARHLSYYGDYGTIAVGEGDKTAASKLRHLGYTAEVIGIWADDMHLYVADPGHVPSNANVLLTQKGQVLFSLIGETILTGCSHHLAHVHRKAWTPTPGYANATPGVQKVVAVDPRISVLVDQVSKSNLQSAVTQLSSYHTRRADQAGAMQATNWLVSQLTAIPGVTVTTETFEPGYTPNVIATIPGVTHPERIVVLGAHYDSINYAGSTTNAPGADDNASGSSAILESARVLAQGQFENTIRLLLFSAEEFGLVGAYHDAGNLVNAGQQVVGMLNMDMISHRNAGDSMDVDFATNNTDPGLTQFCIDVTNAYLPSFGVKTGTLTAGTSDHQAYQSNGIPSVFFFEDLDGYSSVIHSGADLLGTSANDFDLAQNIAKAFVASAASLAEPIDLDVAHAPIGDTGDAGGPYATSATVTSFTTNTVASVDLVYRVDGGAWTTKAMVRSATTGDWLGAIPGVGTSGMVDYYILATDSAGHDEWLPEGTSAGAAWFGFTAGAITTIFQDDFEAAGENGWTTVQVQTQNDWQKGTPQGKSYDPAAAASGTNARGNDLGIGNFNGVYQSDVNNYLESPAIDCSGQTGVRLRYQRWLSVEDGSYDQATIRVNNQTVWQNPSTPGGGANHLIDAAWTLHDVDLSGQADGHPAVRVRFQLQSDGGLEFGGWTIDDVRLVAISNGTLAPLVASDKYLSAAQGGVVQFSIDAGVATGSQSYILGMGASGAAPATVIDGTSIPLVFDAVTQIGFQFLNTPIFANFGGVLSPAGTATATLALPGLASPALAGFKLDFAAFTVAPVTWASNPVSIEFGL